MIKEYNIFIPQWFMVITGLYDGKKMIDISHDYRITYSAIFKITTCLIKRGYCNKTKKGRENIIGFTKKGQDLVLLCKKIMEFERDQVRIKIVGDERNETTKVV